MQIMEPQNVYETLHQNAVLDTDEVDCLPKRGGWTNDSTGYTNSGFDDHSYELPLSDFTVYSHVSSMPDTQNRGRLRENALYQGLSEEEVLDAQNANIRNGIRQFAMATTKENKKEPERSSKNSYNCCLMLCVIILLLASLTSSAYVFYRYHTQKDGECSSKIQGKWGSLLQLSPPPGLGLSLNAVPGKTVIAGLRNIFVISQLLTQCNRE